MCFHNFHGVFFFFFFLQPARTEIEAPVFPSVVFEESSGRKGAYESHVFTQGRYVASTIRASDLVRSII